ncbi:1-(5-phosphoribosyl)-5-((5-phosphoribosylamino)methylideneamino)imidazole-4-carboxamide isomerase [bacterium]|nr:1-(5-phosphoribosyl)-5-((5-phosphoribosylamino)methylideneamino)imidazole-4-carboxamide isomerase [bacterium]
MEVIPGIDLLDDKCVCPVHMSFGQNTPHSHDPGHVAKTWADQGARRLYLADLEGARMGEPQNLKAVKMIIETAKIPVDLGGGIRSVDTAKRVLDLGVGRIVVGTSAALEDQFAKELFSTLGDRTILSLASLNGYVAVRDWQARTDERADDFAKRMCDLGARRIVFTDVSRKGMHGGVNIIAVKRMAEKLNVPIIASGGVSSLIDIQELKALEPIGVEGVVLVTAIYSGTINLADAIAAGI